ncbi:MAG TPA: hypothetical protein PLM35_00115 [Cyclobacteriaceae bacterium]|nr:hypothetical protein [Cyclobacteriaceae bacterium]
MGLIAKKVKVKSLVVHFFLIEALRKQNICSGQPPVRYFLQNFSKPNYRLLWGMDEKGIKTVPLTGTTLSIMRDKVLNFNELNIDKQIGKPKGSASNPAHTLILNR